ncbi:hypothetical protein LOTGIDRAFT_175635 [Lottia gigantea]|uniref:Palmitoyltransferase n=1 Tax=Lottia gigantea TaxID=225164 RepID=V4AHR1_LOTGI|nr:hypothetical protein LOTGIDRAFT_175635 [Lottia gigantea]ESO92926.1 hypothetical protein LOTGIDRAFT_175635 [Lottia gigantea]
MDLYGTAKVPVDMSMFASSHSNRPPSAVLDHQNDSYKYINVPIIGRVRCIKDKNGMISLLCVYLYWLYGTFTTLFIVLIPAYNDGLISSILIYFFLAIAFLCLSSLIRASTMNPGTIPAESQIQALVDDSWTYCNICQRKRPFRAHHCRRCRQCVAKMDHHCPWINNCVGEANHYAFALLLLYAFMFGLLSFILSMLHFWVLPRCISCDREVFYIKHSIWFMYILTALGLNMFLVMGLQLFGTHFNLLIDRTTLQNLQGTPEDGITIRSTLTAYKELFGRNAILCWLLPCRRRKSNNYDLHQI